MLLTSYIDELPNERQRDAVRKYTRGVVLAGPGSGKTHTLVLKVAYLLGQVVKSPQAIACITYMNDAVREIEDRLATWGIEDDNRLFVGTVHKFCIRAIILPFKEIFLKDWPAQIAIADEDRQLECLEVALGSDAIFLPDDENGRKRELKDLLKAVRQYRESRLWEDGEALFYQDEIPELAERYIRTLRANELVDFDDIAIEACDLVIREPVVRKFIVACYPWLVIDEYQDLGRVFNTLVDRLISETEINFLIVGDANQSILGFQGAAPAYLKTLSKRKDVEKVDLRITRRSLPHIVNVANRLIDDVDEKISTMHGPDKTHNVWYSYCERGFEEQIETILQIVDTAHVQGTPYGEIAVLFRNSDSIQYVAKAFQDMGISYSGDRDGRYTRTPLTRWLEDVASWLMDGWRTGKPKFQRIYRDYLNFARQSSFPLEEDHELKLRTNFFGTLWSIKHPQLLVSDWLESLQTTLLPEPLVDAIALTSPRDSKAFRELQLLTQADGTLGNMTVADLALCGRSEKSVFLDTLHSSKGLEFDVVVIPELERGKLPSWLAKTEDEIAEERRLLYVGITRAKKDVHLLFSGFYYNKWGKRFEEGPSIFLDELGIVTDN